MAEASTVKRRPSPAVAPGRVSRPAVRTKSRAPETRAPLDFLAGGGEMGERMRSFNWGSTPLGPTEGWPQSLKTAVRIMLTSRLLARQASDLVERSVAQEVLRESEERLRHLNTELTQRLADLERANVEIQDARRAALNLMEDAVQSRQAVETLNAELRASEGRFRRIFNSSNDAILVVHPTLDSILDANDKACQMLGYTRHELLSLSMSAIHPNEMPALIDFAQLLSKQGHGWTDEISYRAKTGESIPCEISASLIELHGGTFMLALVRDITERRRAEQRQDFLMNELAHRGKNLMAMIQAMVSRSLSGTRSLSEAREVLMQRIQALARSQSVLVKEDFEGAPIADIIRLEFEAFSERVEAVGPDMILAPKAAQTFALLLHELATNATKYGALSLPGGQVAIHWSIEGAGTAARFRFEWEERGGPPVTPPARQGFGRILLEKAVAQDFDAQSRMRFAEEGLIFEIDAPLSRVGVARGGDMDPSSSTNR